MIDNTVLKVAKQLKDKKDAAYSVFRRRPTTDHSAAYTMASKAFTDFCISTIEDLIQDTPVADKQSEILANLEDYRVCKHCGCELLYATEDKYIASSDFLEDFPGWCYTCLSEHCAATNCEACKVADPATCSFVEIKKLNEQE